ncbi:MAG TPA: glycosyltransferase family 39 protein [Vicinamibacterales bacterium]
MPAPVPSPSGVTSGTFILTCASAAAVTVLIGWNWGYRDIVSHLFFWVLAILTLLAARSFASAVVSPFDRLDFAIAAGCIAFAVVVACTALLGAARLLTLPAVIVAQAAVWIGARKLTPSVDVSVSTAPAVVRTQSPLFFWWLGGLGALVVFAIAFGIAHAPLTLYDSLSYHLFFPARWLQEHRLSIIPTPFSDEAQAYAPVNGELFFLWLMLPFHGDLLARIGQLPFALLAVVTVYALARRLGAPAPHAIYPAAFFVLSRPVIEQAIGANVDLICASMFLASLYFGLVALDRGRRRDWALFGVTTGLFAGTKYVALVYLPILLLFPFFERFNAQRVWALPGILAFGLPWYVRNWVVAGSPTYPASLQIAGLRIAQGAFDRGAMLNSVFHTNDVSLLPTIAAHAFGPTLFAVWVPLTIIGSIALLRTGGWRSIFIVALPYAMTVLYWFGLPVNVDSRFLMPAVAPALVPLAFAFGGRRAWDVTIHVAYAAAMAWIVVGAPVEIHASLPWFMQDWLSLSGLMNSAFLLWYAAAALALIGAWWLRPTRVAWSVPYGVAVFGTAIAMIAIGGEHWCIPSRCEYLAVTSPHVAMDVVYGWRWMDEHARASTVAYTGLNLPYPLTGPQLTNRVVYVNIDGRLNWRFHDYDRAYRAGRFPPPSPRLATGSGELEPAPQGLPSHPTAPRPRYERMHGDRDSWMANLRKLNVSYLFVSRLSPYEIDNVWHDDRGFPIESTWASADPRAFQLAYENAAVRVFQIDLTEHPQ